MISIPSFIYPRRECEVIVSGHDTEDLTEMLTLHKHSKLCNLGRLPNEILIKIFGYVVPNCKTCFRQREILRLGSVSKRFNELIKSAELYREINLTYCPDHPPFPTTMINRIIQGNVSQMKTLICEIPENQIDAFGYDYLHFKVKSFIFLHQELAKLLEDVSQLNPTALTHLEVRTNTPRHHSVNFILTKKNNSEPFFERLQSMRINFEDMSFCEYWAILAVGALACIQSLDQMTVRFHSTSADLSEAFRLFKRYIEEKHNSDSAFHVEVHHEVKKKEHCWVADITRKLKTNNPAPWNPARSFRIFLKWPGHAEKKYRKDRKRGEQLQYVIPVIPAPPRT